LVDLLPAEGRRSAAEAIEQVVTGTEPREIALTVVGRHGRRVAGALTLAPIRTEFVTHGVVGLWVRAGGAESAERAA
jgi:hypothetical protein